MYRIGALLNHYHSIMSFELIYVCFKSKMIAVTQKYGHSLQMRVQ